MGNSSQTPVNEQMQGFQFAHPRLRTAHFKKDNGRQTIQAIIPLNSEKQYEKWAEYENYPFILTEEIKNRQQAKHRVFEENQMWYLIYTLADVGRKFHSDGGKVGDIRPENIFINEDGQLKVASSCSWPLELDNYQKAFYNKEKTYLAPEELVDLEIGRDKTIADFDTAESFSTGLTVLDAALLQSSENMYKKNNEFDFSILEGQKENLKNDGYYGDLLKCTIFTLLASKPEDRITLAELSSWLEPHSSEIINLQSFHTNNLHPKIHKTVKQNPFQKQQNTIINPISENNGIQRLEHRPPIHYEDRHLHHAPPPQNQMKETVKKMQNPPIYIEHPPHTPHRQIIVNRQPIPMQISHHSMQNVPPQPISHMHHIPTSQSSMQYSFNPQRQQQYHHPSNPMMHRKIQTNTTINTESHQPIAKQTITHHEKTERIQINEKLKNEKIKESFISERKKNSLKLIQEKIANSRKMYPPE